jgi:dihydroxyacetone kinase-like protein
MKKFINNTKNIVDELLEGFALANPDLVRVEQKRLVVNKDIENAHRVTVVAIGGSGHEPCGCGFVGNGMLDIFVAGEIFTAPGVKPTLEALKIADRGHGILFIVLNHSGDMLTGKLAMEECKKLGMHVRLVVTQEDISNAPRSNASNRRGLVGCVPLFKIAGAAAAAGKSLDEVAKIAQDFADNMATLAVGVKGAIHPVTGNLLAELGDDQMEIGMGQHGEEGGGRQKMRSADDTASIMIPALLRDLHIQNGEKIMLILDGSGATTLMELFIVYRKCVSILKAKNIDIVANAIGELLTVQDAAGFQICIARMDDNLLQLWNAPCQTVYFKK